MDIPVGPFRGSPPDAFVFCRFGIIVDYLLVRFWEGFLHYFSIGFDNDFIRGAVSFNIFGRILQTFSYLQ